MKYLDEKLHQYSRTDFYPFHMPGHKRQIFGGYLDNPYAVDITEITDFDNLHHAEGILKENQELAADLYGTEHTYFLINGSTAGILAAISACTLRGGKILMARNCHKAAYHGAYLRGLKTIYLYPAYNSYCGLNGGISPEDVEKSFQEHGDIEAVLVTSPTYDGMVSDIGAIASIAHRHGIPLIVDEAHGAHFKFCQWAPLSALDAGADVVIHSLHKTLPSLTQTALMHVQGESVSIPKIQQFLGIYQTSSPSYVLMGGISFCMRYLQEQGQERFQIFKENLDKCRFSLKNMKMLHLVEDGLTNEGSIFDYDRTKIVVSAAGSSISGPELHSILREKYHLELEMEAEKYVIALTSLMDTEEGFRRLTQGLLEIDRTLQQNGAGAGGDKTDFKAEFVFEDSGKLAQAEQILSIAEGMERESEEILFQESEGRISAEYAYLYPPGIPLLVPGEKITGEFLENAEIWKKQGIFLQGMKDFRLEKILVVKDS